ncbi:hypothetical protein VHUM_04087 [Vanrija humicola]|uniref:amidase n=1 Tax=Vanrija humicola TaxID=5417 RepID=A0A7D8YVW2_VANHU|nr:hypothetical protein VHUM_04087 [Vanrija humicola]
MSPVQVPRPASEAIASAIAARDATIPAEYKLPKSFAIPKNPSVILQTSGLLSPAELAIVNLDATALAEQIAGGKVSSVQATTAYVKAAALAQQATNCIVELFPGEALERAAFLDAELAAGRNHGAFHGVPVSIKDHIDVKGHDSPSGFLSFVGKMVAEEDAALVKILRDAGAVFYCKTTNPQSLMHLETDSYLGETSCPFNTALTSGGSSGGEGAILGFKASPLGVGADIGGSVRSPAANCGIYSFKPSVGRLPNMGMVYPIGPKGYEGILGTHAPMGRSVRDMELYMRVFAAAQPWLREPGIEVKPWREVERKTKLRIGVLYDDGVVRPVAPIRRALDTAVAKLKAAGHEVVEFAPFKSAENWDIISKLYWPENGAMVRQHLANSGEPMRPLTEWIISQAGNKERSWAELTKLVAQRDYFKYDLGVHWHNAGVDVVLSAVGPTPAPEHGTARYWNYTSYWNLANYPAGVFPTGLSVDPALDAEDGSYTPRNDSEAFVYNNYDAKVSVEAPICLQVIGFAGLEEETLSAMGTISDVVQK